ncbi:MAG: domain S-box protein [Noviherbaspirillum sp.]|nr:domain S-box protein [Noviherbaspirillum sp.]
MDRNIEQGRPTLDDAVSILESITDAFFNLDSNWEFTYVNHQTEKVLGRASSELIGKSLWDSYPGVVGSEFERMYRRAVDERTTVTFTSYYPDHEQWYEVHAYPARDGLSIYFRDVTERIRTEQKLRDSDTRFRLMADSIPQIVWITDAAGNAEFFNRQWRVYTGAPFEPTTATDISARFVHPDDHAPTMQAWAEARREGKTFIVEHRIRSSTGQYRWFLVRAEPNHDPDSREIVRWFGTSTDVHDRKMAETDLRRSEAQYRALFNSIDEGFCIIEMIFDDAGTPVDYRFCAVNAMFEKQTGLRDAVGKRVRELVPQHEAHWYEIYGRVARTGEPVRFENEAKALHRWYDVYAFKTDEAYAGKVAVLFKDITERKRHEQEMQRADRSKDEFLAMLAHELRNPLAPISAAADLLRLARLDETRVRQTSELIARQVRHMTNLVDDLLDVSRVTRGLITLKTEALDAKRIVSDAIEQVRPLIESRRHHMAVHMPPESAYVSGDAKRLVQVVANLLNNAAKYTPEGGTIDLGVEVQSEQVLITVKDNGIGMAADFLIGVFDMFSQAQRTADRSQGGLGIGLALVKSLTELHHGSVTAHSNGLGQGSEFTVRLPRIAVPDMQSASQDGRLRHAGLARLRLMVVDDNADAAGMLAMVLEAAGHEVIVEHDSRRALERAHSECPDAFLLDIGLPEIDGIELARRLRSRPESASSVLIAVTGYGQGQDKRNTAAAGFDHHFVKPVDTAQLTLLLAELGASKIGAPKN